MAPIYESDLAEERFAQDEWNSYELWEKVEVRLRRKKRFWIGLTVLTYLTLSSVPIVQERLPKWSALKVTRLMGQELNALKRDAIRTKAAYRLRFKGQGSLDYVVERAQNCSESSFQFEREGSFRREKSSWFDRMRDESGGDLALVSPDQASQLGLRGIVEHYCYDYLAGSDGILRDEPLTGFAVIPVKDLANDRMDRLSVLLSQGASGDLSFE